MKTTTGIINGFVAVELTPIDVEQFILFQKHYAQFKEIQEEGVFDINTGSAIIDFDSGGNITRIIRQLYSHKSRP